MKSIEGQIFSLRWEHEGAPEIVKKFIRTTYAIGFSHPIGTVIEIPIGDVYWLANIPEMINEKDLSFTINEVRRHSLFSLEVLNKPRQRNPIASAYIPAYKTLDLRNGILFYQLERKIFNESFYRVIMKSCLFQFSDSRKKIGVTYDI